MVYVGHNWELDERWSVLAVDQSPTLMKLVEYSWGRRMPRLEEALPLLYEKKRMDERLEIQKLLEEADPCDDDYWFSCY